MVAINDLLPVGSIVRLKNGIKKIMIFGVKQQSEDHVEYDYIAVLYPEGNLGQKGKFLFNHEDIEEVVFRGFEDDERTDFIKLLDNYYQRMG